MHTAGEPGCNWTDKRPLGCRRALCRGPEGVRRRARPAAYRRRRGFSVVELLVVMAILGILAALAYPSYQEQVRSGRRAMAKAELMRLAQWMERIYTETGCYNPGEDNICGGADDAPPAIATNADGYAVSFAGSVGADAFILQATPTGAQAGDGVLQIDALGRKFWDEAGDDGTGAGADAVGLAASDPDPRDLNWVRD